MGTLVEHRYPDKGAEDISNPHLDFTARHQCMVRRCRPTNEN
jgi:hypothetical protein